METSINEPHKTFYYADELNDDFAATKSIKRKKIDKSYNYRKEDNLFFKLWANFLHYVIVKPVTHLIMVFGYHYKIYNRKAFKEIKKKGCFVFSNHTNYMPDAYIPNHFANKKSYIVVDSSAVSIKGISNLVVALGAIPLADTLDAKKEFLRVLKKRSQNSIITIYPEAHIWPYYTGIRPFIKDSMKYPIMYDVPAYSSSVCYQKRKHGKRPKIRVYIDGPFYPDNSLPKQEKIDKLYDQIYGSLEKRIKENSTYEYIKYVKTTKDDPRYIQSLNRGKEK
jgi:1-acyl-sn-glycerol-3-phosphate acyltransferase